MRTSDDSCLSVCVRLRDASARALVSRIGRASHVSQPTQPVPQPANVGDAEDAEDVEEDAEDVEDDAGASSLTVAAAAAAAAAAAVDFLTSGDGDLGAASVFSGAFNMADNPVAGRIPDSPDATPIGC